MNFFDRYQKICEEKGIIPGAKSTTDRLGISRASVSTWKVKGTMPGGETVARIADMLDVSADYLLGRTDDPSDTASRKPEDRFLRLYRQLDTEDQIRAEGILQGMLMSGKYDTVQLNAAHARTDIRIPRGVDASDDDVLDSYTTRMKK